MTSLLLAPHNDDETLFASFICLREKPHVIVVFKSQVQEDRFGITAATREAETDAAINILGCSWEQWNHRDSDPDWATIETALYDKGSELGPTRVYAPAWEKNGNQQHNSVSSLATQIFDDRVTDYLTYTTAGKSTWGVPVAYEPEWVARKTAALACYRSQASLANCAEHFLRDQHEYVAA